MNHLKIVLPRAAGLFLVFTMLSGVLYTGLVTVLAQWLFPHQANGSMITVNGVTYGSELMASYDRDDAHLWGRVMHLDVSTYRDANGNRLLYAAPSNLSPASQAFGTQVQARVESLRRANPERGDTPIPIDLLTGSASGLDPHISPAAAEYQVPRIARASGKTQEEVRAILQKASEGKLLGILGEETVNVLKANLMLDGIL